MIQFLLEKMARNREYWNSPNVINSLQELEKEEEEENEEESTTTEDWEEIVAKKRHLPIVQDENSKRARLSENWWNLVI